MHHLFLGFGIGFNFDAGGKKLILVNQQTLPVIKTHQSDVN